LSVRKKSTSELENSAKKKNIFNYHIFNIMKKLLVLLLFLILTQNIYSQSGKGLSNTVDTSGNCYVAGYTSNTVSGNNILIMKYDVNGDTLWTRTYSGTDSLANAQGIGIKSTISGSIYVVGNIGNLNNGYDVVILKYASDGTLLWSQSCTEINSGADDKAFGIAVDESDNVYITGYSNQTNNTQIFTAKYNAGGQFIWAQFNNGPEHLTSQGNAITLDHSDNVCVTGFTTTSLNGTDIITLKYEAVSGTELWSRTYNGLANAEDKAFGIAVDQSDNIYVTGYQSDDVNSSNTNIALLKYAPDSSLVWAQYYDGGGDDKAFGLAIDASALYITGYSSTVGVGKKYVTLKYDLVNGSKLWQTTYNGPDNNDQANSIGLIKNNGVTVGVVVTGKSMGTDSLYNYATVSYSVNSGTLVDSSTYSAGTGSNNIATQLAVTQTGTVYVTGGSQMIINAKLVSKIKTQQLKWGSHSTHTTNNSVPNKYTLYQNYPNPFNPSTNIKFDLAKGTVVRITIYDILGKEVAVPINQFMQSGTHEIRYTNSNLSSGIYFYELRTKEFRDVKKMILTK
jgi:Secretion system C-terminal sorting domain/Beta-propeller repeat